MKEEAKDPNRITEIKISCMEESVAILIRDLDQDKKLKVLYNNLDKIFGWHDNFDEFRTSLNSYVR